MDESVDSEFSDSDQELQEAFIQGKLKPGLNTITEASKKYAYNVDGLKHKLEEIKLNMPWIERLDCVNSEAALAPELAAQLLAHEQKRESQLKNNKKLPQIKPSDDPILNDFKREISFQRQAQATVLTAIPKLKALGILTKRPDDYFAEMAKTDEHMQKIREHLIQKQQQQQRSERVKQLRQQKKEGKMLQIQAKLQRQQEKKEMLDQVKKYRKGATKELTIEPKKAITRKILEKQKQKNKKFGFGGRKKGSKLNTKESAADISEYKRPNSSKPHNKNSGKQKKRLGKNKRLKSKNKSKSK